MSFSYLPLALDFYYQGHWRMDWGLDNPNKTAALISCLMVAVWWPVRGWRSFQAALAAFFLLGICLIQTYSRGGLVATGAGLLPVAIGGMWGRAPQKSRILSVGAVVLLLAGYTVLKPDGLGQRLTESGGDPSISNRLVLWSAAPRMMVDAPGGWGLGRSGEAYTQWYQPLETRLTYRTMVNSHLTWLVEFGWMGRFFYLAALAGALMICRPSDSKGIPPAALGVWISFLCSSFFSSTAESWILWILPVGVLLVCLRLQLRSNGRVHPFFPVLPCTASLVLLLSLALGGHRTESPIPLKFRNGMLSVGNPESRNRCLLPDPDPSVLGAHYGAELRSAFQSGTAGDWEWVLCSASDLERLTIGSGDTVLLAGSIPLGEFKSVSLCQAGRVLLLNPRNAPEALNAKFPCLNEVVNAIIGARREDARQWEKAASVVGFSVKKEPSAAFFIRQWVFYVVE